MKEFLLPILFLSACGSHDLRDWHTKPAADEPQITVEPPVDSLRAVLASFLNDCGITYKTDVSNAAKIEFIRYGEVATSDSPSRVGVCYTWTFNDGTLFKSNITVKKMDTVISNKALLYHELGHCVLGLDHTEPTSRTIMSPIMLSDSFYEAHWDELVKDLCHKYRK